MVRLPDFDHLRSLGDEIVEGVEGSDESGWRWNIHGPPARGKRSLLVYVAATLRREGRRVLHLAPPLGARDSGMVAASQLSLELSAQLGSSELLHTLHDPDVRWDVKVAQLRDALEQVRGDVVIVASEPDAWASSRRGGRDYATVLALLVRSLGIKLVMTSSRTRESSRDWMVRECVSRPSGSAWVDELHWEPAQKLPQLRQLVPELSPAHVRLLAAYSDLTSVDAAYEMIHRARSSGQLLPRMLYRELGGEHEDVRRTWRHLALLRTPLDESLLSALGAPEATTSAGRLVRDGLLTRYEDQYVLHDTLRHAVPADRAHATGELRDVRLQISAYYLDAAERQRRPDLHLEAFHHAALCLDVEAVSRVRRQFAEQALIFADRLFEARRAADAGRYLELVYDTSLASGRSGSGSGGGGSASTADLHHRLAFAADANCDAATAELHYRRALAIDARDPQLHSRFICFLLDVARIREAREAWGEADAALPPAEDMDEDQLAALYGQVAWRLVRLHDLDFAETVLCEVPAFKIEDLPSLRTVQARLRALRLAQQHGPVRPFGLLTEGWWHRVPDELQEARDGEPLRRWWAGRVSAVDASEGVAIELAEVELGSEGGPIPAVGEYSFEELEEAGLPGASALRPGSFLVAGYYGDDAQLVVRPVTPPDTRAGLPRLELHPQRYLKLHNLVA